MESKEVRIIYDEDHPPYLAGTMLSVISREAAAEFHPHARVLTERDTEDEERDA